MLYEQIILWTAVILILGYVPYYCRLDLKDREIPHNEWMPLVFPVGATAVLYAVGFYPIECLGIALVMVAVWFAVMKLNLIEGADFIFLSLISLLFVVNPISGRILMPVVVAEFVLMTFLIVNIFAFCFREKIEHFPMIPVISAAFILAVVLG